MFFQLPETLRSMPAVVQALLDEHAPIPNLDLNALAQVAAATPPTERCAVLRRYVVDADGLLDDVRWHIGQALLIWEAYPAIAAPADNDDLGNVGIPNRVALLLRPYVSGRERVFFDDLLEPRSGGTVGGWMIHMMVDGAVTKAIGVLDRLAHVLLLAADVPAPRGRMYFRNGKLAYLRERVGEQFPASLLELGSSEELEFLLAYPDGLAHTFRPTSGAMRAPPVDTFIDASGRTVIVPPSPWGADELIAIALSSFDLVKRALPGTVELCRRLLPQVDVLRDA